MQYGILKNEFCKLYLLPTKSNVALHKLKQGMNLCNVIQLLNRYRKCEKKWKRKKKKTQNKTKNNVQWNLLSRMLFLCFSYHTMCTLHCQLSQDAVCKHIYNEISFEHTTQAWLTCKRLLRWRASKSSHMPLRSIGPFNYKSLIKKSNEKI